MDVVSGLLILLLVAPAVHAVQYTVGDSSGWGLNTNYNQWASGKTFQVGDTLLFNYGSPHSVDQVSSSDYKSCTASNALQSYTSGADVITLKSAGSMYFMCPVSFHCSQGMKLSITVSAASSTPATAPTATPSSSTPPSSTTPSTTTPSTTTPSTTTPSTTTPSTTTPSSTTAATTPSTYSAGNLCNINALVLGLGVSLVYVLMG